MNTAALQLGVWDQSSAKDCEATARSVAQRLPAPWQFTGLHFHEMGGQRRHVGFFDWNGLQFALVPGGTVTLGYDRGTPPVLTDAQRREYEEQSRAASGFPELPEYLDRCMTPLREVTLRPFLLEVEAGDASGLEKGEEDVVIAGVEVRMGFTRFTGRTATHRQVLEQVGRHGFRLPTSDEWEHACGAGSRTLWRWGPACPPISDEGGEFELHRRPNAFGLRIACDSYQWEWCTQPDVMRGGDGGCSVCGGEGDVVTWLTLATPYALPPLIVEKGQGFMDEPFFGHVRRAFSLPAFE